MLKASSYNLSAVTFVLIWDIMIVVRKWWDFQFLLLIYVAMHSQVGLGINKDNTSECV